METLPADVKEKGEDEKLLQQLEVPSVVQSRGDDGTVSVKSSKKVKLPEDERVAGGRFTIGPAPERDWEMVPPDGGWGWCVLVGATLVNILIPGMIKTFGVLLVEFKEVFNTKASANSGIVALCYFLYSSLGPLSSILSVKWSYRTVTLIGGSFAAFGMILSYWAHTIPYLYFSLGAMVGTGAGLAFPPTVYIVTSYFVRRRGLANGICMSGSAFGSIILPPILRLLLESYGYKGAVLLLGGLMLNVWAAALLFRPVEEHMVKMYKDVEEEETPQLETFLEESTEGASKYLASNDSSDHSQSLMERTRSDILRSGSTQEFERRKSKIHRNSSKMSNRPSNPSLVLEPVPEGKPGSTQDTYRKTLTIPKTPKRSPSSSSFQYMSTPFHGSTLSAFEQPSEFASQFSLKSITDSLAPISYCCGCKKEKSTKKEPNKYFDIELLKDPIYLVILFSNCTTAISYTNFIILVPSYAAERGFDKALGAYLLSIISALDLVGRIGGSALSDVVATPKRYFFIFGLLFSGVSLAAIPLLTSYYAISTLSGIFGFASGVNTGVTALVMTEMLGTERLMSSYGISLFVNGILQLIGPPVCGLWYEAAQSYRSLFISLGFVMIGGASLWLFVPIINSRRAKKSMEEQCLKA